MIRRVQGETDSREEQQQVKGRTVTGKNKLERQWKATVKRNSGKGIKVTGKGIKVTGKRIKVTGKGNFI